MSSNKNFVATGEWEGMDLIKATANLSFFNYCVVAWLLFDSTDITVSRSNPCGFSYLDPLDSLKIQSRFCEAIVCDAYTLPRVTQQQYGFGFYLMAVELCPCVRACLWVKIPQCQQVWIRVEQCKYILAILIFKGTLSRLTIFYIYIFFRRINHFDR